jgi:hypothetical protein
VQKTRAKNSHAWAPLSSSTDAKKIEEIQGKEEQFFKLTAGKMATAIAQQRNQ